MEGLGDIPFPLYDALVAKIGTTPYNETELDLKKIASAINHLPESGEELGIIYALMIRHSIVETQSLRREPNPTIRLDRKNDRNNLILYNGKTFDIGKGLMYSFSQLPPLLQQIIVQYVREIAKI